MVTRLEPVVQSAGGWFKKPTAGSTPLSAPTQSHRLTLLSRIGTYNGPTDIIGRRAYLVKLGIMMSPELSREHGQHTGGWNSR